jgi:nitrogen fixation protein NifU and related proteins
MSAEDAVSLTALERFERPRNYGPLDQWDGHARITGPCGDTMEFWLNVSDRRIVQATFITDGCGSSRAAGSMATELATGKLVQEALQIEQNDVLQALGGLPQRSEHCALLAADTLKAAIRDCQERKQVDRRQSENPAAECPPEPRSKDDSE